MFRELREFRRLQRVCKELENTCCDNLEREGLLRIAEDYQHAIDALQRPSATARRNALIPAICVVIASMLFSVVLAMALYFTFGVFESIFDKIAFDLCMHSDRPLSRCVG